MKHLAVWKIYGAFSPCDLATANNLNAETLYKVANATYKFVKGQNRHEPQSYREPACSEPDSCQGD